MQYTKMFGLAGLILSVSFSYAVIAETKPAAAPAAAPAKVEAATADEVVKKVQEAAKELAKEKDKGLAQFNDKEGKWDPKNKWIWKDTYVFVYDCDANKALAHPSLTGKTIKDIKDKKGKVLFDDLCAAGKKPMGGWSEYMWSKPGAEGDFRKITFAMGVAGTSYQVAAGIYDDKTKVEDLNKALK